MLISEKREALASCRLYDSRGRVLDRLRYGVRLRSIVRRRTRHFRQLRPRLHRLGESPERAPKTGTMNDRSTAGAWFAGSTDGRSFIPVPQIVLPSACPMITRLRILSILTVLCTIGVLNAYAATAIVDQSQPS